MKFVRSLAFCLLVCAASAQAQVTLGGGVTIRQLNVTSVTSGNGGAIPTPPAYATTFSNMQDPSVSNPGSWTQCDANNNCAAGTPSCIGVASLTTGNTTPSLSANGSLLFSETTSTGTVNVSGTSVTWVSGNKFVTGSPGWAGNPIKINGTTYTISTVNSATSITLTTSGGTQSGVTYGSTTGCNTLQYRHMGSSWASNDSSRTNTLAGISNAILDEWVYVSPDGSITGPEWDPDFFVGSAWTTKVSIACYASGGGHWDLYDQSGNLPTGGAWVATNLPCNFNGSGANTWHHIVLWITLDQVNHKYTYEELDVDGTPVFTPSAPPNVGPTFNSWQNNGGNALNLEFQLDNSSGAGTSTENLDQITFIIW